MVDGRSVPTVEATAAQFASAERTVDCKFTTFGVPAHRSTLPQGKAIFQILASHLLTLVKHLL